jgi:Tol biopolymer transport system component
LSEHAQGAAWSPDGTRVAYFTSEDGDPIVVADRTGGNARQIFVDRKGVHNHYPAWSLDGRWIYYVHIVQAASRDVWRVPSSGGTPERLTEHNDSEVGYPTPIDARTVIYVARAEDQSGPWLWALDVERKLTRRVSVGLEKYLSVAASADGRRLVATVADPTATLWSVPILDRLVGEKDATSYPLPGVVRALAPRFGGTSLFYLSSRGAGDGLWRFQDGQVAEIWKGTDGPLLEPPAISPDGRRAAVVLRKKGKAYISVVSADGAEQQSLAEGIDVHGTSSWSPDAKWIVTGGDDARGAGLFKIPIDGGAPIRLLASEAINPVWSPDGGVIVYAGEPVASTRPLLAVRPDGTPLSLPAIRVLSSGATAHARFRFLPDGKGLVYMQGAAVTWKDFWLLDMSTQKTRQLTRLSSPATMSTFDISPDGKQIVFDRLRENSDIVLIDLPK